MTKYLGCTAQFFYERIRSMMIEDMTLKNTHLDHIKPVSKFDLTDPKQLAQCTHYTNFQPLFARDNIIKSNKWSENDELNWRDNIIDNYLL